MAVNKYGILSLAIGLILFFGTYAIWFSKLGWMALLGTLLAGGLLWLGLFFAIIGLLMLVL